MNKSLSLLLASLALAATSYAVETRFWQQTDQTDFEKGSSAGLSLRSDGRLFLAPDFHELFDPSVPYLWAIAADGKGNLYAGGGGSGGGIAKLFAIGLKGGTSGKVRTVAELEGLEIHAIAVGGDGQIYAATDPDGKVYKISPQGKVQVFFDPHAKYIWALAFNAQGDLFVATGDQGEIFRVGPDGKGSVFFKTGETHARSLAIDSTGNLIVGTEPGGLILRVTSSGNGFVLYQTPKREVTAVAISKTGQIYAACVENRNTAAPPALAAPAPIAVSPITISATGGTATLHPTTVPPPGAASAGPIAGGSEVYRIDTDGSPRKIWSNSQDIVYAIGFDLAAHPLLATGNRGRIYRLDSNTLSTELIDASPTQITNFADSQGHLYVATGNIGRVYELGGATVAKGTFESDVLDAGSFSYWGRLSIRGTPSAIRVFTRSGNLNRPEDNWSPWAPLAVEKNGGAAPCARCLDGRVVSPSARFLQYKAELSGSPGGPTPELASVEIAYLAKNVAPVVEEVEITPPNYKFPAQSTPSAAGGPAQSLNLPALGQKKRSSTLTLDLSSSQTLTYAKGMLGARWTASDENGDTLTYAVEIRGVGETAWNLLKDKVRDKYVTWDSTAFPDGEYELRVTASDAPSNTPAEALSATLTSDPFLIDNTPPRITNLTARPEGGRIEVRWQAQDARSIIDHAEYSINGGEWIPVEPKARLSDAPQAEYGVTVARTGAGDQTIAVRVTDSYDNQAVDKVALK